MVPGVVADREVFGQISKEGRVALEGIADAIESGWCMLGLQDIDHRGHRGQAITIIDGYGGDFLVARAVTDFESSKGKK